jgi:CMP-N,N'-diacetyllegionaminic acid synthase
MSAVAIIPAREHSRRCPGKNLREVGGRSLLERAIDIGLQAKALGVVDDVVVSVEDTHTHRLAHFAGATVVMRGPETRTPEARVLDVVRDVLRDRAEVALACVLLPTSPLRTLRHVVESRLLLRDDVDGVMSVTPFRQDIRGACLEVNGRLALSALARASGEYLKHDGSCLWARRGWLETAKDLYDGRIVPYRIPPEQSVDVDTEFDLRIAGWLLADGKR